jgi:hypothetical protein
MSSKNEYSRNSNTDENDPHEKDYGFFIENDIPLSDVRKKLSLEGKNEKEIEEIIKNIIKSREKIKKTVRKFMGQLNTQYGHLDIPDLMKKGIKYAVKAGLNSSERKVFEKTVLKGDAYPQYTFHDQIKYTEMAKFFGYTEYNGTTVNVEPKDYNKLNELQMLYDATQYIHADVKKLILNYRDCAPEAIRGEFDSKRHNVNTHIHPVIAALFIPKIDYLDKKMLYTNMARMILLRGQAFLKNSRFQLGDGILPGEIDEEYKLSYAIATDPNSLAYTPEDSPLENIIRRFKVQIELWLNVLNLRQGKYYSEGYESKDGILGLIRILNSYQWSYFDSPELFNVQDEGTILRKLLAVFSLRPTRTEFREMTPRGSFGQMGYSNMVPYSQVKFINTPIINVNLPYDPTGSNNVGGVQRTFQISLSSSLTQTDYIQENRMVIPKNKQVVYSEEIAFFYANRKYPSISFNRMNASGSFDARCINIPSSYINTTSINTSKLTFSDEMNIGPDRFILRSVILLRRPPISGINVPTGCSAAIVVPPNSPIVQQYGSTEPMYIHYDPLSSANQIYDPTSSYGTAFIAPSPVTYIDEEPPIGDDDAFAFRTEAYSRGTIFLYVKI